MDDFGKKLAAQHSLIGTFVKTPEPIIMEVLALSKLNFVILDAEHAPFGRRELDQCIMTCRLAGLPCIVRLPDCEASSILNAFDCGATGIQLPHVKTAEQAKEIVRLSKYGENGRGFAGSTRQAKYGTSSLGQHLNDNKEPIIIVQIEDPEGVDNIDAIAEVEGISAVFIGRVDLAVAYNETDLDSDFMLATCEKVCKASQRNNVPIGTFLPNLDDYQKWNDLGVSFYAVASEHAMIIRGFNSLMNDVY